MPRIDLTLRTEIKRTGRVAQLEGMFDVPRSESAIAEFHFDVPLDEKPWRVGLIIGPSGAGKSSVARHLFPDAMVEEYEWKHDESVVDCFPNLGIRETSAILSSVGFSSPPGWLKPYRVLSNGEKFRCTLARALADERPLIVFDEFTSVVDRTVAKIGSHAVAKAIRKSESKQFVAVSCHDDIVEWLQPDWILEPHVGLFRWRFLQRRPSVSLDIVRCDYQAWRWFAPHHYLTADLHRGARCFVGLVDGRPAAFAGILPMPHPRRSDLSSLSRLVVHPDYQGLGIGSGSFIEGIAKITKAAGRTLVIGTSHPGLVISLARSRLWQMTRNLDFQAPTKRGRTDFRGAVQRPHTKHRRTAGFKWVGGACEDIIAAKRLWA